MDVDQLIVRDVLETLEGMEDSRRCFRVVDSILVERNVGEVKKALQTEKENVINPTGIEVQMMVLMGQLNTRSRDLEKAVLSFEVCMVERCYLQTKYGITKAVAV